MRALLSALVVMATALPAPADVTVFAAASLKTALDEIAADWTDATGTLVVLSYGSTAALAKQITEGAPADVFLSASTAWMDDLAGRALIQPDSRRDLLGNRLVLIGGTGAGPVTLDASLDLAGLLDGGRLSLAFTNSVPAGQYGKEALESLGLWAGIEASVVQSENVRAALQLVALGEAPFGVVYASDAVAQPGVVAVGTFPEDSHTPIVYPAALTMTAAPEAADFLAFLGQPKAAAVFVANGFRTLP
jgi:molybdate transport system substrate-binding protein